MPVEGRMTDLHGQKERLTVKTEEDGWTWWKVVFSGAVIALLAYVTFGIANEFGWYWAALEVVVLVAVVVDDLS